MKSLFIIFAVYLLLVSCFSCMCDDGNKENQPTVREISRSAQAGDSKDDNCNPFCSCSCCLSATFFNHTPLQVAAPFVFYNIRNFAFTDQYFISYNAHTIWQPPKLS